MRIAYRILFFCWLLLCACSSSKKNVHTQDDDKQSQATGVNSNAPVQNNTVPSIDTNKALKEKYAKYLAISSDSILNIKLYTFIDRWLNTPYKWGGIDEKGIDCSAFIQKLLNEVYNLKLPRTSIEQLYTERVELFASPKYLSEGDILFFRTMENKVVSHVGIYLHNYMFVNSSSAKGVSIANLRDIYWKQRFVVAGRIRASLAKQ